MQSYRNIGSDLKDALQKLFEKGKSGPPGGRGGQTQASGNDTSAKDFLQHIEKLPESCSRKIVAMVNNINNICDKKMTHPKNSKNTYVMILFFYDY